MSNRKVYPSEVSDEEWAFVAPYLTLMSEDAPQRVHALRDPFDAVRWMAKAACPWRMLPGGFPPWMAVAQQAKRWGKVGCFEMMREATAQNVEPAYAGKKAIGAAAAHGIELEVVKLAEAKRGFILLPCRRVAERSFAWPARFRRLSRDYERLPSTPAGLHWLAFACLLLGNLFRISSQH